MVTYQTMAGGCVLALACDFRIAAAGEYNIGVDEVESHAAVRVPSCADGGCRG